MNFHELSLGKPILRAVDALGYTTPTPIQTQAIPEALTGRDVLGCAQTGAGKTCAFALPVLHRLADPNTPNGQQKLAHGRAPRALVLCPTRELASQIFDSFVTYGRNLNLRHTVVFGGVSQFKQVRALRAGIDVLVATPGRLHDLINQGYIDLREIQTLVLDEADRMLDMGFINDIRKVVEMLPAERQTLFFSATLSPRIRRLADSMLRDPIKIETTPEATTVEQIDQRVYLVERRNKPLMLERLLGKDEVGRTLVFTRTKYGADKLTKILRRSAINADSIHGDKSQNARTRALHGFKTGATKVLVATDVASRGIDVDEITHVINFDMPIDPETYVHRVGRTARAGAAGVAVTFCDRDEMGALRSIERRTGVELEVATDFPDLAFERPTEQRRKRPSHHSPRNGAPGKRRPVRGHHRDNRRDDRQGVSTESARPRRKKKVNSRSRKANTGGGGRNSGGSGYPRKASTKGRPRKSNAAGRSRK